MSRKPILAAPLVWKPLSEYRLEDFNVRQGAFSHIQVNQKKQLTKEEMILALTLLAYRIESERLRSIDSDMVGDKSNECSWGLCEESRLFPHPSSHRFPMDFIAQGRTSAIRSSLGDPEEHPMMCPMDRMLTDESENQNCGCFYRCRVFSPKGQDRPNQEEALRLIDLAVKRVENWPTEVPA